MNHKDKPADTQAGDDRAERLKAALRVNLHRRKAQARARQSAVQTGHEEVEAGAPAPNSLKPRR